MAVRSKTIEITNEDITCKRYRRPIVPEIQTTDIPHYLRYRALSGILQENSQRRHCTASFKLETHKNAGTQTDYRESEVQTEPWEPPYKIVSGHNPEILTLDHLTWKHGLPAGVHEIHIINRMQMKKAWESILPPMDTPANIKLRNSIITILEIDKWAFREAEIQFIMDLRLNLMKNLLQSRELQYKRKMKNRFNRLYNKLGKHRDDQVKTIRDNLKRNLRKLYKKYHDSQSCKPDTIEYSQKQYDMLQKQFLSYREKKDTTLNWLPAIKEPKAMKRKSKPIDICIRETRWTEEKLKQFYSDLKAIRMNVKSVDVIPRLRKRNYEDPTLSIKSQNNEQEEGEEESATFTDEKFVEDREIQCPTFEEQDEEEHREKIRMIELQQLQDEQSIQEDRLCEILNSLEGRTICGTLDFLSKELVRLEDERRTHAFALLAERERCMREAAEADRRQLERNRQREFDEMFKQIVKVNQDSTEAYLEDIIREGVEWMSDKTAKEHILQLYKADDTSKHVLEDMDKRELTEEELVTDMIYNFVLPEVEKHNVRRKICDRQQSYMRNAYISVYEKILNLPFIESSPNKNPSNQKVLNIEAEEIEFSSHKTDTETKIKVVYHDEL